MVVMACLWSLFKEVTLIYCKIQDKTKMHLGYKKGGSVVVIVHGRCFKEVTLIYCKTQDKTKMHLGYKKGGSVVVTSRSEVSHSN